VGHRTSAEIYNVTKMLSENQSMSTMVYSEIPLTFECVQNKLIYLKKGKM
jgi:hypothetical protein